MLSWGGYERTSDCQSSSKKHWSRQQGSWRERVSWGEQAGMDVYAFMGGDQTLGNFCL